MKKNQFITAINEVGQSIWYDNLSLDVLSSGELKELVSLGVSGLTSNPTIFKKAIADSSHYDGKIVELARQGLSADDICESLMIDDVGAAADLLRDTFERTRGADGYASIEVSPVLAHDASGTVEAAKRLWKRLNRQNVMIKIPATEEGVVAVREVLSLGINVNVTLIFSCDVYKKVAQAYLDGIASLPLERKKQISSVASFFVSRVDSIVEQELGDKGLLQDERAKRLVGLVGIANSKLAYEHFEHIFLGKSFQGEREQGVPVQRPLWASTGTKNKNFSPLLYVEALVGRYTVNTLPPATLQHLMQDATIMPRLHEGLSEAKEVLRALEGLGINFDALLLKLQHDGVKAFADSYQELVRAVEEKSSVLARSSSAGA